MSFAETEGDTGATPNSDTSASSNQRLNEFTFSPTSVQAAEVAAAAAAVVNGGDNGLVPPDEAPPPPYDADNNKGSPDKK